MAIIVVAFFGVVIAVNLLMATLAVRTFGGTVVDNSYVASQRFNGWLNEAREQSRLNWTARTSTDGSGRLVTALAGPAGPLVGASVEAHLTHPLGRQPERLLALAPVAPGSYRTQQAVSDGRWNVRLIVRRDGREARYLSVVAR